MRIPARTFPKKKARPLRTLGNLIRTDKRNSPGEAYQIDMQADSKSNQTPQMVLLRPPLFDINSRNLDNRFDDTTPATTM
jgi:hypothetical protein